MQQNYLNLKRRYVAELQKKGMDSSTVDIPGDKSSVSKGNRTYTVVSGDSLMKIAKKVYGDAKKYKIIYGANRKTLKKANKLKVGQILIIP